jgi:hypothetical protein
MKVKKTIINNNNDNGIPYCVACLELVPVYITFSYDYRYISKAKEITAITASISTF